MQPFKRGNLLDMIKLLRQLRVYAVPVAIVLFLKFGQSLSELYLPTLLADIVDIGIVNGDTAYIIKIGFLMLFVAAVGTGCAVLAGFLAAKVAAGFGKKLRRRLFTRAENFSLQEFDRIGTASLITRTTNDVNQIQQVLIVMMRMMISAPLMFIGGIIMAVSRDAMLSLLLMGAIPIIGVFILFIASKGIPLFRAMQLKLDRLNLVLRENLIGIRVIRAFNRAEQEKERFNDINIDLTNMAVKVHRIMGSLMPVMMLLMDFTVIAVIWMGSLRIDHGYMQVGDLMAFIQYFMLIMFSLGMVSMMFMMFFRASVSAARINEVLEIVPEIKDGTQTGENGAQKGVLELQQVTFGYPGAEHAAVSNISFIAKPGEVTALIGGTGSGKSTLLNLILRFYDVDQGRILIDGLDIRQLKLADLRAKIGFVPQKSFLFSGTIADNIRYGKKEVTDQEIERVAAIAQASGFIADMKNGFNDHIAQGGSNVSGGQRQRLAIARALIRRPQIYLFDDSFSALDFKTDARLRAALKKETAKATVLIVAQRVSTVVDADQIIVLEEGKIVGAGRHKELMDNCKVYREIVSSQLAEEEIA